MKWQIHHLGEEVDDLMEMDEVADSSLRRRSWSNGSEWSGKSSLKRFFNVTFWKKLSCSTKFLGKLRKNLDLSFWGHKMENPHPAKIQTQCMCICICMCCYVMKCDVMYCDVMIGQIWFHLMEGKQLNDDSLNFLTICSYLVAFMLEFR